MNCIKCGENVECIMCEVAKDGVFIPPHICPNAHKDCESLKKNIKEKKLYIL